MRDCYLLVDITPEDAAQDYDVTVFLNNEDNQAYVSLSDGAKMPAGKLEATSLSVEKNNATEGSMPVTKRRKMFPI